MKNIKKGDRVKVVSLKATKTYFLYDELDNDVKVGDICIVKDAIDGTLFWVLCEDRMSWLHPDDLELITESEWVPKVGDLVWCEKEQIKGSVCIHPQNKEKVILFSHGQGWNTSGISEFWQPYTGQDNPNWPKSWKDVSLRHFFKSTSGAFTLQPNGKLSPKIEAFAKLLALAEEINKTVEFKDRYWTVMVVNITSDKKTEFKLYVQYWYSPNAIVFNSKQAAQFSLENHRELWETYLGINK